MKIKHSLRKRILASLMGVLFLFLQFLDIYPAYSQSIVACAQSVSCASELGILKSSMVSAKTVSLATPVVNPFLRGAAVAIPTVAALGYLGNQALNQLADNAIANASSTNYYLGRWYVGYATGGQITGVIIGTPIGIGLQVAFPNQSASWYAERQGWSGFAYIRPDGIRLQDALVGNYTNSSLVWVNVPDPAYPASPPSINIPEAINSISNSAILAAAAAAAATAARDAANVKDRDSAIAAAAAAAAAAGLIPVGTAERSAADQAAADASSAAQDAANPNYAPSTPKSNIAPFTKTNFLAYAVSSQGFGNKFPFGMFAPLPASQAMQCPTFKSWGKEVELCFIRDIISVIKYIIWVNFAIYSFVNL